MYEVQGKNYSYYLRKENMTNAFHIHLSILIHQFLPQRRVLPLWLLRPPLPVVVVRQRPLVRVPNDQDHLQVGVQGLEAGRAAASHKISEAQVLDRVYKLPLSGNTDLF